MSKIVETDLLKLVKSEATARRMNSCGWRLVALLLLYLLYLLLGAAVFSAIEAPIETEILNELMEKKEEFLASHPCVQEDDLDDLLDIIVYSSKRGVYAPIRFMYIYNGSPQETVREYFTRNRAIVQCFDGNNNYFQMWILIKWDLWICGSQDGEQICWNKTLLRKTNNDIFLIITLLGYGEQSPLSGRGKVFCMFYCILGIPLTLLLLSALVQRLLEPANKVLMWLNSKLGHLYQPLYIRLLHLIMVFLIIFLVFLVVPAFLLNELEEDWTWFDSFYYCFISLTTVGLGDFIPGDNYGQQNRPLYKAAITVYLLLGLIGMMLLMTIFTSIPELDCTVWFLPSLNYQDDPERQRLHTGSTGTLYSTQDAQETLRVVRARSRRDDEAEWDDSRSTCGDETPGHGRP
ncbi:potassium channel subfamily K member 1 [Eurytemora carolleeae]|uniref:potassium channel subfamily K member 1 n=1 Tax=Eurytemora carolleeae TaxID=1294199 RepID=UPI000C75E371|nr:potassium channel subfamily K member 1 [Eurytemora carolleeae]|eukprot:XP_023331052.1 potassium channel subfamily K member 1-like [Eurytemora affinis]